MSRCLNDRALLLLHDGAGTGVQHAHLTECVTCAARYGRLEDDLKAIGQALRDVPPPMAVSPGFHPFTVRWLPMSAVAALAIVLVWQGVRLWNPSASSKWAPTREIMVFLEQFPSDVFSLNQAIAEELGTEVADADDLVAALDAEWPSE